MTEESSSPGGWSQIGYLTEMDGRTFLAGTVWTRPLATPGEIENCTECGKHAANEICVMPYDLTHMRYIHHAHSGGFVVGFDGARDA